MIFDAFEGNGMKKIMHYNFINQNTDCITVADRKCKEQGIISIYNTCQIWEILRKKDYWFVLQQFMSH